MRVLHLMSCRGWSSDAHWAGLVARELRARGHQVTFAARADAEVKVLRRLRELGVTDLCPLPFRGRRAPLASGRELLVLRRLMAAHDVVHVHRSREHWMAALAGALAARRPLLVRTRHIVAPVRPHALNRWLYSPRVTAGVIAVSERIRAQYIERGLVEPARVRAIPGGVDATRFRPDADGSRFRRQHGFPDGERVIGLLAGLRGMKGHATFLEAARALSRASGTRFAIVGAGRHAAAIRRAAGAAGLGTRVVMTGFVERPEEAVAAFDVAVYASDTSEGMGRVLFEYMAAGRPIAATRVGLVPEVLADGQTALIVPPRDAGALAAAIARLLEDRDLAARLGEACRRLVEARYSAARVAAEVEAVYTACRTRAPLTAAP